MNFETFKEIYENKSLEDKFYLFNQTMQLISGINRQIENAEWRRNQEDADYERRELEHMNRRAEWLFDEIVTGIRALEGRAK